MSNTVLKSALIGCGYIADKHITAFFDCPHTELVALCDADPRRLKFMQEKYGVLYGYTSAEEMLKALPELELVSVCVPNKYHAAVTIQCLEAGKHVLLEKPMAVSAEEARAIIDAEKKATGKLMIVQNQRFIPAAQIMKRMFDEGKFGEVYHIRTGWRRPLGMLPNPEGVWENGESANRNWYNDKSACGGVLRDLGVHLLDLAMYITGFPKVVSASASGYRKFAPKTESGKSYELSSEDMVTALIKFENGMSIALEVSFCSFVSKEALFTNVYGTKCGAERDRDNLNIILPDEEYNFKVVEADIGKEKQFKHCIHEFADALVNGKEIPVRAEQALRVIEALDLIYASMEGES